jgi:phosphatidate phosphatase PAH1
MTFRIKKSISILLLINGSKLKDVMFLDFKLKKRELNSLSYNKNSAISLINALDNRR